MAKITEQDATPKTRRQSTSAAAKATADKRAAAAAPSSETRTGDALDPTLLRRVIVEGVTPQVDEGRYPAKRTVGETVVVEADVYADGHDEITALLLWRKAGEAD